MSNPAPPSDPMAERRSAILNDIRGNRLAWRWTEIPQIIILFTLVAALLVVTGFGLYTAISMMKAGVKTEDLGKIIQVFVTGSSSLLGFVVFKLMAMLGTKSKAYLKVERRFTSDINLVQLTEDRAALQEFLKGYYNIKD
ncbi:MAG: hypothetical protein ABFD90_21400 [Phycisphaerales bacterium]